MFACRPIAVSLHYYRVIVFPFCGDISQKHSVSVLFSNAERELLHNSWIFALKGGFDAHKLRICVRLNFARVIN